MTQEYVKVGEAMPEAAFLTNDDDIDVAILRRVDSNDEGYAGPTDAEWQRIINLVDAAPRLCDMLQKFVDFSGNGDMLAALGCEAGDLLSDIDAEEGKPCAS